MLGTIFLWACWERYIRSGTFGERYIRRLALGGTPRDPPVVILYVELLTKV
jgi:hypothetical protein